MGMDGPPRRSAIGKHYYSHRMSVVEPVFGNIGTKESGGILRRLTERNMRKKLAKFNIVFLQVR